MSNIPIDVFGHLFSNTYGVQLAGLLVSGALYGASVLQAFIYYMSNPKDELLLKAFPGWLILISTVHQFILSVGVYKGLVNHFGDESVLTLLIPEVFIASMLQGVLTTSAHLFYIYRIYAFSGRMKIFPLLCIPITFTGLTTMIVVQIRALTENSLAVFVASKTNTALTYVVHGINLFLDIVFTIAMLWFLKRENNAHFKRTQAMINRLVVLTINTGLAPALCTFLLLVLLAAEPNYFSSVFFVFLVSPLYCNSALANLNSRSYVRGGHAGIHMDSSMGFSGNQAELSSLRVAPNRSGPASTDRRSFETTNHESTGISNRKDTGKPRELVVQSYDSESLPTFSKPSFS